MLCVWWSQKYKLPRNHPLFLDATIAALLSEWYGDTYAQIREIEGTIDGGSLAHETLTMLQKQRNIMRGMLGLEESIYTGDVVFDYYETELAAGRDPQLHLRSKEILLLIDKRDRAAAKRRKKEIARG